ncbi:hypothetical protein KEM56_001098 [Ascosphaera pollenicola]|nr:hypothetical protein KEM56_001098 [Ascosphaera pollenicola]
MLANDCHSALQSSDYPADTESDINSSPSDTSSSSRPSSPFYDGLPANFGEVVRGVYRSSFPQPAHLASLKNLKLKTIITLVDEEWSPELVDFARKNNITSHTITIAPNKTPGVSSAQSVIDTVLSIILEPKNHPVLIHCNKGRHWNMTAILAEYQKYAAPKARLLDKLFIQHYDPSRLAPEVEAVNAQNWRPSIIPICLDYPVLDGFHLPKDKQSKQLDSPPPEKVLDRSHGTSDSKPL